MKKSKKEILTIILNRPDLFFEDVNVWSYVCFLKGVITYNDYYRVNSLFTSLTSKRFLEPNHDDLQLAIDFIKSKINDYHKKDIKKQK